MSFGDGNLFKNSKFYWAFAVMIVKGRQRDDNLRRKGTGRAHDVDALGNEVSRAHDVDTLNIGSSRVHNFEQWS